MWNQTFTDGDPRKTAMFHAFFHMSLRLLNLITRGGTPLPLGSYALYQGLIAFFINLTMAEARDFHCYSHVFENLGTGPFRVITQQSVLSLKGQQIGDNRANAFQAGCTNIPFFPLLKRLHDDHRFSTDPFGALAEFKVILEKGKKQTIRELSLKTPDSIGAKLLIASTALTSLQK